MEDSVRTRYTVGLAGVAATIVALLFLPFAGFEEKLTYFYPYEITGVGTYGDGFFWFKFPAVLFYVQILLLVGAAALVMPVIRLWGAVRRRVVMAPGELRWVTRVVGFIGAGAIVLLLLTMFVLLPTQEDNTIWNVDSAGFLTEWWPGWGAFVAIACSGAAAWALKGLSRQPEQPPPPPPPPQG